MMTLITQLWVDDRRPPPVDEAWVWCKTLKNTIDTLELTARPFEVISLDYTLDGPRSWDENGGEVLKWLALHPEKWPTKEIRAHSSSASGRELLVRLANDFKPPSWTGRITNTGGFE